MSKRYEYKYVRVKLKGGGFSGRFSAEYQNEIKLHAN
jgi:hypothetical protein